MAAERQQISSATVEAVRNSVDTNPFTNGGQTVDESVLPRCSCTDATIRMMIRHVNDIAMKETSALDDALGLMYHGVRGMTREADRRLAIHGLARSHHRILFVIARHDGISVGDLRNSLGVSAQAMHRPLKQLSETGMIATSRDPSRHRFKALHLTERGRQVEYEASEAERSVMRDAFLRSGTEAAAAWSAIMADVAKNA